jgi:tRNA A37 methylthiotransferase MiaB
LLDLQNEIALELNRSMIGKNYTILCESPAKLNPHASELVTLGKNSKIERLLGRTEGDHIIHFDGPSALVGQLINIRVESAQALWLGGVLN